MPEVDIYFPGTATDYTYHDPKTGEDQQMVEWTFNAVIDGQLTSVSGVFESSVSEERAAYWIKQNEMLTAEGSTNAGAGGSTSGSNGGGSGGSGGGDSGGGIPGTSGSGEEGHHSVPELPKMKTKDGT